MTGEMSMRRRPIIAIDGPAGSGKSTVARAVASRLGYLYIDTGAMYRAVALKALREDLDLENGEALTDAAARAEIRMRTEAGATRVWLDGREVTDEIRSPAVTDAASRVSAVASVRQAMVRLQRAWGQPGGVVMEGRDIGTVVFPSAEVKIFLDASPEERARRRARELATQGAAVSSESVGREMAARDARDRERLASPLVRAPDAVLLLTDGLAPEQVVERALGLCRERGVEP
jgi:cytidylate kinase